MRARSSLPTALVRTSAGDGGAKFKSPGTTGSLVFGSVMRSKSMGVEPASLALATVCGACSAMGVLPQPDRKIEKTAEFARKTKVFWITGKPSYAQASRDCAPLRESSASASILGVDAAKAIAGGEEQSSKREESPSSTECDAG